MDNDPGALILDPGSLNFKFGFANSKFPIKIVRGVVGKNENDNYFVGDSVFKKNLKLKSPLKNGIVTDWDSFEKIFSNVFYSDLKLEKTEQLVLISEPCLNPKAKRERMCQLMFDNFKEVVAYYTNIGSVLSLYESGRTTGSVVTSGFELGEIVQIYEGYALPHAYKFFTKNGKNLTELLRKTLERKGYEFKTKLEQDFVRKIKEKCCFLSLNPNLQQNGEIKFVLPNKKVIKLGEEVFKVPEEIFSSNDGVHTLLYDSIMMCDVDIRKELCNNIIIAGGNTLFKNFETRLQQELSKFDVLGKDMRVIKAKKERQYTAWIGGSILGSLSTFVSMWISREEYNASGPSIVLRKCF